MSPFRFVDWELLDSALALIMWIVVILLLCYMLAKSGGPAPVHPLHPILTR